MKRLDLETEHVAAIAVITLTCGLEISNYVIHFAVAQYAATKGDFCSLCYDLRPFDAPLA